MRPFTKALTRSGTWTFSVGPLLLASCVSTGDLGDPRFTPDASSPDQPCTLKVENHGWTDLHLYAVRMDGTRLRLGTVGSLDERRVRLPKTLMAAREIQLLAVPAVLGPPYLTESVMLEGGTTLHWQLKNELPLSTLVVR